MRPFSSDVCTDVNRAVLSRLASQAHEFFSDSQQQSPFRKCRRRSDGTAQVDFSDLLELISGANQSCLSV